METDRSAAQALPDEQIIELAQLGQRIQSLYGLPQDIEWAWANQQLYILQSRPITSLFPTPAGLPAEPLKVMVSFGAVQGSAGSDYAVGPRYLPSNCGGRIQVIQHPQHT